MKQLITILIMSFFSAPICTISAQDTLQNDSELVADDSTNPTTQDLRDSIELLQQELALLTEEDSLRNLTEKMLEWSQMEELREMRLYDEWCMESFEDSTRQNFWINYQQLSDNIENQSIKIRASAQRRERISAEQEQMLIFIDDLSVRLWVELESGCD
jgi:hypothetical protein